MEDIIFDNINSSFFFIDKRSFNFCVLSLLYLLYFSSPFRFKLPKLVPGYIHHDVQVEHEWPEIASVFIMPYNRHVFLESTSERATSLTIIVPVIKTTLKMVNGPFFPHIFPISICKTSAKRSRHFSESFDFTSAFRRGV